MAQISQSMPMVYFINGIMEKYRTKGDKWSGNDPTCQFVTIEAKNLIKETKILDEYEIDSGCGSSGNWADCPYVAIMYKKWKKEGVCVAYILSHNYNEVYLTLNQFVNKKDGDKKEKSPKTKPKEELNKNVSDVLKVLGEDVFDFHRGNEGVDFASQNSLPKKYKDATILYKKYEEGNIPDESALRNDLANLMKLYRRWIDHCENAQQKGNSTEESEQLNSENASQETSINPNEKISGEVEQEGFLHQNVIFYGVPGCGKSHRINELLHLDDPVNGLKKEYYKRILFHPEYSYSDFVGQLRPVTEGKNITYQFVPGPFTEILCDAYKDREHEYFLIIEEINRGNAPAIFGDLFQLLDRKDSGASEYSIDSKDILDYFKRESEKDDTGAMAQAVETIKRDGVRIPKNLTIFATMNTCDQNVFTLDTAFKRRWRMSRIKNKFDSILSTWKIHFENGKDVSWKAFAEAVNDAILNNCNDGAAAEDKQLGAFFVKQNDVQDVRRFAEKVLLYLWDDVAKYDKSKLFDTNKYKTLDAVIAGFVEGENVFSPNCAKLNELYDGLALSAASVADEAAQSRPQASSAEDGAEEIPEGQPEA